MTFAWMLTMFALVGTLGIFDSMPTHSTPAMHIAAVVGSVGMWGVVAKVWRDAWMDSQKTRL